MRISEEDIESIKDQPVVKPTWDEIFDLDHGNFVLAHGESGTGKSFFLTELMYIAHILNFHNFCNIRFQKRVNTDVDIYSRDAWEPETPDGIDYTTALCDLFYKWCLRKIDNSHEKFILTIDEFETFIQYAQSKSSKLTQILLQQNRKLDMCILGMVHDWGDLPYNVLKWADYLILKMEDLAKEYLKRYGVNFEYDREKYKEMNRENPALAAAEQKLAFVVPVKNKKIYLNKKGGWTKLSKFELSDVVLDDIDEIYLSERTPWSVEPEDTEEGDHIFVSKSPGAFQVGEVGERTVKEWWPKFIGMIFHSIPTELPYIGKDFFENPEKYLGEEELDLTQYELAEHLQPIIRSHAKDKDRYDNPVIYYNNMRIPVSPGFWEALTGGSRRRYHEVIK